MKITNIILTAAIIGSITSCSTGTSSDAPAELVTEMDSVSYSIGLFMGKNLKKDGFENLNEQVFLKAMHEMMNEEETLYDITEAGNILNAHFTKKQAAAGADAKEAGAKFLAENAKREGVVTLPSGLQYEVITVGSGAKPTETSKVKVHYHGTLIDGTVFDSSVERGESIEFPVNGVIKGWTEALQLMPVGSKWKLYIPYDLAYGERGAGQQIKPFSTLLFDVELIDIVE